jgi:hypothetical protein
MGNMFRSAVFKLTAVYVGFVMAVSLAFSHRIVPAGSLMN